MQSYKIPIFILAICLIIATGCKQNGNVSQSDAYDQAVSYYREKDYTNALKLFSRLAQGGNVYAQGYMGVFYKHGLGVEKDPQEAAYWYSRAAEAGLPASMATLGGLYRDGLGVEKNCSKSVYWYEKAAERGDTIALNSLGYMYRNGVCVDTDIEKGNAYWVRASKFENEFGLLCKALTQYYGVGGDEDYASSRIAFEELADRYRNASAFFYLYRIHYFGLSVERDVDKGLELCRKSSELGMPAAAYALAVNYFKGTDVEKNYDVAFRYAMKSAGADSRSAYLLGVMHEKGLGVPVDIEEAKKWYRQAVDMGYEKAQKRLSGLQ